ncbi:MAG: DUF4305 domain-containing protein [Enterococcus casseliflavus]
MQREDGWGVFTIFLIIIATFDIGGGLRMIAFHFKMKKALKEKIILNFQKRLPIS